MIGVALMGLLVGLAPSFGSFTTSSVDAQDTSSKQTTALPAITGHDTDKETADDQTSTQTADDHNTNADAETNDDQKSSLADDHNTKADPETNDGG
jgi:hypothetical protein